MAYTNFVTIRDISSTGSLWDGVEVLILGTEFDMGGNNLIAPKPKTFQDTTLITADTDAGDTSTSYKNNYDRRKGNVSYTGFSNPIITIKAKYHPDKVGNTVTIGDVAGKKIFTPSKLFELILKPRTVYIKDEFVVGLLQATQDGSPVVYGQYGIPVILQDWKIIPSDEGKEVVMDLTFVEDKGDTS